METDLRDKAKNYFEKKNKKLFELMNKPRKNVTKNRDIKQQKL